MSRASEAPWLLATALLSLAVIIPRYLMQLRFGPGWDAYTFLLNAIELAGKGADYVEIYRPPLLPFIVSLFVRAGVDTPWPLFFVDAAITLLGVLGLYLLLRCALSRPVAMIGSLAFLALPDVAENLSAGITDLISVSVSIWLVYFLVRAMRDDPAWLSWSILLVPVGFISRFTAGMMLFVIVFALVYDGRPRRFLRPIRNGVLYSLALLIPYFAYYWWRFGDPLIQLGEPFRAVVATTRVGMLAGVIEPRTYFILNAPIMMGRGWIGWALLALVALGLIVAVVGVVLRRSEKLTVRRAVILGVGFVVSVLLVAGPTSFLPVLIAWIAVLGWMVPRWLVQADDTETFIVALMLFWLALYLTIHSHMLVKVTRYYLTMAPPVVFLLAYPLERLRLRSRAASRVGEGPEFIVALSACAALIAFGAWHSMNTIPATQMRDFSGYSAAREWMDTNVPRSERAITSDAYPGMRYRLRRTFYPMPPFSGDRALETMSRWLDTNQLDYFVTVHTYPPIPGFESVFRSGDVSVYQRTKARPVRKQTLLIGRAVDRHLNEVIAKSGPYISAHLNMIPDDYSGTAGTWIDEFTPEQLAAYDSLYLYRFRWHDQDAAEKLLRDYAASGHTVLIDASGNLGSPPSAPWGLEGVSFLDVLVARAPIPTSGAVRLVDPSLAASGTTDTTLGPFTAEEGGPWYAATYRAIDSTRMRTLVEYAGSPLVFEERVGAGRIVWISGNLGFHAFIRGTADERRLIRDLLDYANTTRTGGD